MAFIGGLDDVGAGFGSGLRSRARGDFAVAQPLKWETRIVIPGAFGFVICATRERVAHTRSCTGGRRIFNCDRVVHALVVLADYIIFMSYGNAEYRSGESRSRAETD